MLVYICICKHVYMYMYVEHRHVKIHMQTNTWQGIRPPAVHYRGPYFKQTFSEGMTFWESVGVCVCDTLQPPPSDRSRLPLFQTGAWWMLWMGRRTIQVFYGCWCHFNRNIRSSRPTHLSERETDVIKTQRGGWEREIECLNTGRSRYQCVCWILQLWLSNKPHPQQPII